MNRRLTGTFWEYDASNSTSSSDACSNTGAAVRGQYSVTIAPTIQTGVLHDLHDLRSTKDLTIAPLHLSSSTTSSSADPSCCIGSESSSITMTSSLSPEALVPHCSGKSTASMNGVMSLKGVLKGFFNASVSRVVGNGPFSLDPSFGFFKNSRSSSAGLFSPAIHNGEK